MRCRNFQIEVTRKLLEDSQKTGLLAENVDVNWAETAQVQTPFTVPKFRCGKLREPTPV